MQQDIANIQTDIDNANAQTQAAQNMPVAASAQSGLDTNYWRNVIANTKSDIVKYQKQMSDSTCQIYNPTHQPERRPIRYSQYPGPAKGCTNL
jgi:hypothetical protein